MKTQRRRILTIGLLTLSLFLISCAESTTPVDGSSGLGSRTGDVAEGKSADCNAFSSNGFSGAISTSINPTTNTVNTSQIRLKFDSLPSEFFAKDFASDYKVEFFVWKKNRTYKATGIGFTTVNNNGATASGQTNSLNRGQAKDEAFLDNNILILQGVDYEWQALTIALYPVAGGAAVKYVDVLIPRFEANPNTYNTNHLEEQLRNIHPFSNYLDWSDEDYFNQTEGFCQTMVI